MTHDVSRVRLHGDGRTGRVGVVGLGAMGSRIAERLLAAGHAVVVWNRSDHAARRLSELGAIVAVTPADAAARSHMLITMLADPSALEAVSKGHDGILAGAHQNLTVIEMSTVGPAAIARLAAALPTGVRLLDAPVLGSIDEAESGKLTILAGGSVDLVGAATPLLTNLGVVRHVGPLGAGAAAKLVANATLLGALATLGESLALADGLGLTRESAYRILAVTPLAAQAARRRPTIEQDAYPRRFALSLAHKDSRLVAEAARDAGVELHVAKAVRAWLAQAELAGRGGLDYTAILATILAASGRARNRAEPAFDPRPYDGLIVDLDGVVWLGQQAIDGAVEAIASLRQRGTRIVFLTNNPEQSRTELADRLTALGIPTPAQEIVTAGTVAARYLAMHYRPDTRVLVVGAPALRDELEQAGFSPMVATSDQAAEVVVVGGHAHFDYHSLCRTTAAISRGARLIATSRDPVVPGPDGPQPATGAILAAIETATGVTATAVGKPEAHAFAIARHNLPGCERIAVVGDRLDADIAGARRAGLDAILVLTGSTTETDLQWADVRPDIVLPALAALPDQFGGDERTESTR